MKNPETLRPKFWEKHSFDALSSAEWEALCDGCGKCCLVKLEDADTAEIAYTNVACKLFDNDTCRCAQYDIRKSIVPSCIVMTPQTVAQHTYWLPSTCAYKRLHEGNNIPDWHPLLTGDPNSVHDAGISVIGGTVPEYEVDEDDLEDYVVEGLA